MSPYTVIAFLLLVGVFAVHTKSIPRNNATLLISKYAKVAHWGSSPSKTRSQGQIPWTHRSDVQVVYGQNLRPKYDSGQVPAIGEVQERYNPKPYFDYAPAPTKKSPPSKLPSTFDSFPPVYKPPESSKEVKTPVLPTRVPKPPSNLYASPYDSYNPPPSKPDTTVDSYAAPPKELDSYAAPPKDTDMYPGPSKEPDSGGYVYTPPPQSAPPSDDSDMEPEGPPDGYEDVPKSPHSFGPPLAPSSHEEGHAYFPPDENGHDDDHNEVILDHPPPGYENKEPHMAPPPPPPAAPEFPHYLYDDPHQSHHVYHEVEHETTTPAPEHMRVNKGHYSYYYLGRKLWYIPLYFSVYFIIYVTVLILKSIGRHKINLKHDYLDHHSRQARDLGHEEINQIHHNVISATINGDKQYHNVTM